MPVLQDGESKLQHEYGHIEERKKELRSRIKTMRNEITFSRKAQWDRKLQENFFRLYKQLPPGFKDMPVFLYLDFGNEAGTRQILSELWEMGMKTAVPRVEKREAKQEIKQEIAFYEIRKWEHLEPGYMGILEPALSLDLPPVNSPDSLVVVPGVAFDPDGCRLGYGGGFYDRFLSAEPDHLKWGLAYDFQVMGEGEIPVDPWDQKMDIILTPEKLYGAG